MWREGGFISSLGRAYCLSVILADTPSFLTQSLRKPFSKSKWPVDDLSQGCKGLV